MEVIFFYIEVSFALHAFRMEVIVIIITLTNYYCFNYYAKKCLANRRSQLDW